METSRFSAIVVSKFNERHIDQHLKCVFELLMVRDGLWPLYALGWLWYHHISLYLLSVCFFKDFICDSIFFIFSVQYFVYCVQYYNK